jgi:hypothetical protein
MLRAMTMMKVALAASHQLMIPASFNEQVVQSMNDLIKQRENKSSLSIHDLKTVLQKDREKYSEEEWLYVNGFLFSAEVLVNALGSLKM